MGLIQLLLWCPPCFLLPLFMCSPCCKPKPEITEPKRREYIKKTKEEMDNPCPDCAASRCSRKGGILGVKCPGKYAGCKGGFRIKRR